ncbi:MAG: Glycosyl transferase family 39 [Candidatus Moranbacteria bacterium GW2011_GWE1_35_17]|nr:MAG: Glycosyl transferase family 39 [Candidatus Moranbacteria bacterium GW2011_GWE1_35_17]KKP67888.1 MAG: Glycosyl transferase family 39 [Candidatus Moranbacteria bacterium GW2011_GWE2_35_164]KKP81465.1 MAG: Glycosyl transferase family 39 [Candidatus Moranbacteria bacterium GW2011_GWF1_35_5]KKP81792.1 MAG: Glycosyl transferase family 39 [Candidatus Moranbacteria bacterium GW2011_GWF2_35_54]
MKNLVNSNKKLFIAIFICFSFIALGFLSNEGFNWKDLRYSGNAITTDELAHIPSGYYYLRTGRYFLNVEHPPLVKDISALPLLFLNPVLPNISSETNISEGYAWENYPPDEFIFSKNLEIRNAQWDWARVFLFNPQNNPELIVFWARLSVIFFNTLFLFLLYILLSKTWNKRAAIISLFLITFSQFSLANGSLVTMDFISSILQMLAIVSFSTYIKKFVEGEKTKLFFAITLSLLGLALLSKFSSAILVPSLFMGGVVYISLIKKKWKYLFQYILRFTLLSLAVLLFISIFYYFHTFNMDNSDMVAQLNHYHPNGLPLGLKELLITFIFSNPILKGLAQYISGVVMVFSRMSVVYQQIFFMGNVYGAEGAGVLYFPVLYFAKLNIGLLILNFLSILLVIRKFFLSKIKLLKKVEHFLKNPLSFLLTVFVFFYAVVTLSSDLQIGLRHIMPIILGITILTAKALDLSWDKKLFRIKFGHVFFAIFLAIMLSVLFSFPNYISYYNYFAGGSNDGYKIATDSNFDWGQDAKKLVKYVEDNKIKEIYIDIEGNVPFKWYLGDAYKVFNSKRDNLPVAGSYLALSMSKYKINNDKFNFLENNIIEKVGQTIIIFQVP